MKKSLFLAALAALCMVSFNLNTAQAKDKEKEEQEHKIAFKKVPSVVRKTFKREANGEAISTVDKEKKNGKIVYEADVKIDGHNYEIVVSEDGLLLSKALDEEDEAEEASAKEGKEKKEARVSKKEKEDDDEKAEPKKKSKKHEEKEDDDD